MNSTAPKPFTLTQWLILSVAAIGFLFDTYELLMTPLVGVPAIAELLKLPPNHPTVTVWMGRMLWMTALCGGLFGLLGGWLIDRFGRKRILALSIFVYALSPFAAAFSSSLPAFVFFRCTTFVGVCVEFVAAITWLAELFPDKKRKERVLGWTQAFASLGGVLVTAIAAWINIHADTLPALPLAEMFNQHAAWRYTLMTGLLPAIPIALMLPFVPESQAWRDRRASGTLKRPSFGALFAPDLRRVTLVTAALSACAYAAAFGALQTIRRAPALGTYLAVLVTVPVLLVMLLGARWTQQGHTFARYVFPVQVIYLIWMAIGFAGLAHEATRRTRPGLELALAAFAAAGYLVVNPAIRQVATLGPWYGHLYHHFDYVAAHNVAQLAYLGYEPPRFYRRLDALEPHSVTLIEAPFTLEAPVNDLAFVSLSHHQREIIGLIHDLCLEGPLDGEVPKDGRFRFRNFVFLDDRQAVLATGARYLLLRRDQFHGRPFREADRCLAALTKLYGEPVDLDSRLAVFDLHPAGASRKLQ